VIHIFVNFEDSEKDVIQLVIDENNDLTFKVAVQGTNQNPTMSRLLLKLSEDKSIAFSGRVSGQDSLSFVVPSLVESVKPETTYECSVEMVVEGRFFVPCSFPVQFKVPVKCVTESVIVNNKTHNVPSVKVVLEKTEVKTDNRVSELKKAIKKFETQKVEETSVDSNKKYFSLKERYDSKHSKQ